MMKKISEKWKKIKENPKEKAFLFFGVYLLFFLVVFFLLKSGDRDYTRPSDYEKGNPLSFRMDSLLKDNYLFVYIVTLDDVTYEYYGQKYNSDIEMFEYQNMRYYRNGNDFYVNNTDWSRCENPYIYPEFLNTSTISSLIEKSSYESKTNYESGKTTYNFLLSSNTIDQYLYKIDSDFFEEPNRITLSTDEEKNVNEVIFYLDSFCEVHELCKKSMKIEVQYDFFGEITPIDTPIS